MCPPNGQLNAPARAMVQTHEPRDHPSVNVWQNCGVEVELICTEQQPYAVKTERYRCLPGDKTALLPPPWPNHTLARFPQGWSVRSLAPGQGKVRCSHSLPRTRRGF
jgi:hypothetical protein